MKSGIIVSDAEGHVIYIIRTCAGFVERPSSALMENSPVAYGRTGEYLL